MVSKEYQKPEFSESDIRHFAQAFDVLLEGAIQNHLVDEHGKLAMVKAATETKKVSGGGND